MAGREARSLCRLHPDADVFPAQRHMQNCFVAEMLDNVDVATQRVWVIHRTQM